jgi:hypothetical protein
MRDGIQRLGVPVALGHAVTSFLSLFTPLAAQGQILHTLINSGVYSGSPSGFGLIMVSAGDVNGDARADLLFGAPGVVTVPFTGVSGLGRLAVGSPSAPVFRDHWGTGGAFGSAVASGGDADGDGVPDYAIGAYREPWNPVVGGPGQVQLFSGATGSVLQSMTGTLPGDNFASTIAMGDCNGDGYCDVTAGTNTALIGGVLTPELRLMSGRDGSLLWTVFPPSGIANLMVLGDVNGDGCADIVANNAILSGFDGSLIRYWTPPIAANANLATAPCGDIDGDGIADFVVGQFVDSGSAPLTTGAVAIISGATGSAVRIHVGTQVFQQFGYSVAGGFHADADDIPDYAVRSYSLPGTFFNGGVQVFAGATGALLQTWITPNNERIGAIANAGDIDGDGTAEMLIGSVTSFANPFCGNCGVAYVYQVAAGPAASTRLFGRGCPSSSGRLPVAEARGRPRIGSSFDVRLRAGPLTSFAIAFAGTPAQLDLTPIGAPGCMAHVAPFWSSVFPTSGIGVASFPVAIPSQPSLIGFSFDAQWAVLDVAANALGLITSTAVRSTVGG